jgi:hypothetical protein
VRKWAEVNPGRAHGYRASSLAMFNKVLIANRGEIAAMLR